MPLEKMGGLHMNRIRTLAMSVALAAGAAVPALQPAQAAGETRGYAISWFGIAACVLLIAVAAGRYLSAIRIAN